ncbi:hypothetical protein FRC01_002340 [Tulasnella sp. 417]|nr:hypothetical protein FRC01_002340 [Tulasnella sp. 417]
MAETRRVVAYGRKKQNFVTVKSSSVLPSPTSTPPRRKQEVIVVDDDSSYPPIEFIPEPNKLGKSSLKGAMEAARKQQVNKENATQTGHARHASKRISTKPAVADTIQTKQYSPGRPTKAAPRRSRAPVVHATKSPVAVRCPLGVKAVAQHIKAPAVKTIEIITLDSDGSEVRREERNPPRSIIDLCSPSGSSRASWEVRKAKANLTAGRNRAQQRKKIPPNRVVSDESESDEDPIVFSPRKKAAPRQRKLVVVSDDDDDADDAETTPLSQPGPPARDVTQPKLGPRSSVSKKLETAPPKGERLTGRARGSLLGPGVRPSQSQSQNLFGGKNTRARVSEAIASLPKDVIDSIARTGDLSVALGHLTPQTRRHLEGGEVSEDETTPQSPSKGSRASNTRRLEDITTSMGRLVLAKGEKSSQRTKPPPKEQKQCPISPSLKSLLETCNQSEVMDFETFISEFPQEQIHGEQAGQVSFRKLGEASYSEVFAIGEVVIKVVPLLSDGKDQTLRSQGPPTVDMPSTSAPADVNQEIVITREIGELQSRFTKLLRAVVVKGAYPQSLLDLWDEYDQTKGSENIRPSVLPPSTYYALIILPNGGTDLESYVFPARGGWKTCVSVWWQIARALGVAEDARQFEHRDLHWGQVLVQDSPEESGGVSATIIDFGLSRMVNASGKSLFTTFEPEIFDGKGDYQFDIYRMMKAHVGDDWGQFKPLTNVMWLHYLAVKLLKHKGLRRPAAARRSSARTKPTPAQLEREEERVYYETLVEIEAYLGQAVKPAAKRGKKAQATEMELPKSACDVLIWLAERTKDDDEE